MKKITKENIKDIEIITTVEVWQLSTEFILELSLLLGLKQTDLMDLLGLNKTNNPEKLQLSAFVEYYSFLSDIEKDNIRVNNEFKKFDFKLIEKLSKEFLEKQERQEKLPDNFINFLSNLKKEDSIYKKAINLISFATKEEKGTISNSDLVILVELIYMIFNQIQDETLAGFFFIKIVKNLQISTILLNFIKTVRLIIQNGL